MTTPLSARIHSDAGPYSPDHTWTFRDPEFGLVLSNCRFSLIWEPVHSARYAANWMPSEVTARELFRRWRTRSLDATGVARIDWFVRVERRSGRLRTLDHYVAPFQPGRTSLFDDPRTVPVSEQTGDRVNWLRVPVVDQVWDGVSDDPAGFIQQALGWKPGALDLELDCDRLWSVATGRRGGAGSFAYSRGYASTATT